MNTYPSPPHEPPDLTPPGTPRGRYKIPSTLRGGQISSVPSVTTLTDKSGHIVRPNQKVEHASVQKESSIIVQKILDEVARDLQEVQSSEPNSNTLEPEQPDNNLIGSHVQGAARAPLAIFCNISHYFCIILQFFS